MLALLLAASLLDLRVDFVRQSLTGTHIHSQQFIDGIPVIGGERIETIGRDGRGHVMEHLARKPAGGLEAAALAPRGGELVYLNENGVARLVSRVIVEERPFRRYANDYDARSGALIRSEALFWNAQARVFDPNPVARLNRPDLQDQNNAASAVPDAAYSNTDLPDLAPSGALSGPNVQIVDTEPPHPARADASQSLLFDRSQPQFEEVNAYYHIDKAQRYLQSLGYTGSRRIVAYAIPVDPHGADGTDNSFFISGFIPAHGELVFGDGGTDDAEDSDIMLHEFGHAIQEWIDPGVFGGPSSSQSRALSEGFGDYWSFSSTYNSGRDPFCIGDWDARCSNDDPAQACAYPPGADCLRRVDGTKTMADFVVSEAPGTEHRNGEIWSSALREIFMAMIGRYGLDQGKRLTDTIVIEGTFGVPANPTYALMGRKLLDADRAVNQGADVEAICRAMVARAILSPAECVPPPRGEVTWFQSPDHGLTGSALTSTVTVTDARVIDKLDLNVELSGVAAGDAGVTLRGPDGTSATGTGSLDAFHGHTAAGVWTLTVNTSDATTVTLLSWSVVIRFAGDQVAAVRPAANGRRRFIAAVAHAAGVNGTRFVSDVRILNRGASPAEVEAIFTPTGADGRSDFAAVKIAVAPSQIVTLDDLVQTVMRSDGTGQLEISGGSDSIAVNSRTWTRNGSGTMGQYIPGADPAEAIGSADLPISVPGLENTPAFRSNIGFAEVAGVSGTVHVRMFDAGGTVISEQTFALEPFGHLQTNVLPAGEGLRAEVSVGGDARVLGYGSVIDNLSGDAIFIPAARLQQGWIPVIHAPGINGTTWRTDVWFSNPTSTVRTVLISSPSRGAPPPMIELQPRATVVVRDFLRQGLEARNFFCLPVNECAVQITSRTYTLSAGGSFGQFIPAGNASMESSTLLGVENDSAFRTNIGLISDSPATVRLVASDAAGREVWRSEIAVNGLTQLPLPVPLAMGRLSVEVLAGDGVVPYASVVDNRSGDPIYINPIR